MKTHNHIYFLLPLAWLIGSAISISDAAAQNYPARPIRLIVPQAPGSSSGTLARIVAIELTKQLGQQVVVDNRPGGALTIGMELFKSMTGTQIVHIPYKGGAAGIADLIAGQVQLMMEGLNSITPHAKAGRVRALGVSGARRPEALPDVPTIAEAGVPGYEASTWNGIVVPVGVPRAIVNKLNAAINQALASPSLKARFAAIGADPAHGTPEQFAELIRTEYAKWGEVIKRSGAKID